MPNFNGKPTQVWRIIVPEGVVTDTTFVGYYSRLHKILHLDGFGVELEIPAHGEVTEAGVGCLILWIATVTTNPQIEAGEHPLMLPMLPQDISREIIDSLATQPKILDIIRLSSLDNLQYYLVGEAEECSHESCLIEGDSRQ